MTDKPRNYYHSQPTTWSRAYAEWLSYSEANNEERKNGWKPNEGRTLLNILTGQEFRFLK
jgi:hypothetical protein